MREIIFLKEYEYEDITKNPDHIDRDAQARYERDMYAQQYGLDLSKITKADIKDLPPYVRFRLGSTASDNEYRAQEEAMKRQEILDTANGMSGIKRQIYLQQHGIVDGHSGHIDRTYRDRRSIHDKGRMRATSLSASPTPDREHMRTTALNAKPAPDRGRMESKSLGASPAADRGRMEATSPSPRPAPDRQLANRAAPSARPAPADIESKRTPFGSNGLPNKGGARGGRPIQ